MSQTIKDNINYKDFIFDTAVIGAGPAGLSAAVRARFIKSRGAYPMSAVVFDSSETAGGLANFGGTKLTGPAFTLERGELISKLLKDIELFDIPIIGQKVIEVKKSTRGGEFLIKTESVNEAKTGAKIIINSYRAKSVIIASGMRPLSNELQYFNKGVEITYMGYDFINKMISGFINDAAQNDKKFIIYGNKYSLNLINFVISAINGLKVDFNKMSPLFLINADESRLGRLTYCTGNRNGRSSSASASGTSSRCSSSAGPLYQGMLAEAEITLSPKRAESGMGWIDWKPSLPAKSW